jgi:Immunity protein 26
MSAGRSEYPFVPRSSVRLTPGDFWAVPLADGSYGCGRVVEHMPKGMPGARVGFLGSLLDWHAREPPTSDRISGAGSLDQGVMHIWAITKTGGVVLGNRPLHLDHLEPWTFIHGNTVQKGFTPIRPSTRADVTLPAFSWWGYDVIQVIGNKRFLGV